MRLLKLALTWMVVATPSALAADMSGAVWKYVQGKASTKPASQMQPAPKELFRSWVTPPGVAADGLALHFLYRLSNKHWYVTLTAPRGRLSEFVGSPQLRVVRRETEPLLADGIRDIYEIQTGVFKGLLAIDEQLPLSSGNLRVITLMTPQLYRDFPERPLP